MTLRTCHSCCRIALLLGVCGCGPRELEASASSYADVETILLEHCASCHGGDAPAAGWSVQGVIATFGCDADGGVPVAMQGEADGAAPRLLSVLSREDHAEVREGMSEGERSALARWLDAGAPTSDGALHPGGWLDPRSPDWHGRAASQDHFARLLDLSVADACGHCHAGAPVVDPRLKAPPEAATSCTSCHDQPGGVLACGTCHGDGARAEPPRDPCLFPEGPAGGAHAAHLRDSALGQQALSCNHCHPSVPLPQVIDGQHADGEVDVLLSLEDRPAAALPARASAAGEPGAPSYDPESQTCSVGCHQHGGALSEPSWDASGPLGCGHCHGAPPQDHYAGACSGCHPGVDAEGTALRDARFHLNGRVDLGRSGEVGDQPDDREVRCGACHGSGSDPWPQSGAHPAHRMSAISAAVSCQSCHQLPVSVEADGHLPRAQDAQDESHAEVRFGAPARAWDQQPSYDPQSGRCAQVACHGAGLPGQTETARDWQPAIPGDARCGSCHGLPPPPPHVQDDGCEAALCHGGEISPTAAGPRISSARRALHIDGTVQAGPEP